MHAVLFIIEGKEVHSSAITSQSPLLKTSAIEVEVGQCTLLQIDEFSSCEMLIQYCTVVDLPPAVVGAGRVSQ